MSAWDMSIKGKAPYVGEAAEMSSLVTMQHVDLFTKITGDKNPLHYDEELAKESIFGGLIVQGGVTSGILNALVAEMLPGPGTVFLGVEWKFSKAVYVGDEITGRVEVLSVRNDKPICELRTTVCNQHGDICLSGTASTFTVPLKSYQTVS
ncbi:MAG: MaoC family dehydratase [Beijerinckiaceae bacterium]|nr:MAG: MaoC family dehydratase [Beijerinckiaceae bacterium]